MAAAKIRRISTLHLSSRFSLFRLLLCLCCCFVCFVCCCWSFSSYFLFFTPRSGGRRPISGLAHRGSAGLQYHRRKKASHQVAAIVTTSGHTGGFFLCGPFHGKYRLKRAKHMVLQACVAAHIFDTGGSLFANASILQQQVKFVDPSLMVWFASGIDTGICDLRFRHAQKRMQRPQRMKTILFLT